MSDNFCKHLMSNYCVFEVVEIDCRVTGFDKSPQGPEEMSSLKRRLSILVM